MSTKKNEVMATLNCAIGSNLSINTSSTNTSGTSGTEISSCYIDPCYPSGWGWWRDWYYPTIIRESYPVYLQERSQDKGKKAFEIIKILSDKKLIKMEKVKDFVNVMDELIKIL